MQGGTTPIFNVFDMTGPSTNWEWNPQNLLVSARSPLSSHFMISRGYWGPIVTRELHLVNRFMGRNKGQPHITEQIGQCNDSPKGLMSVAGGKLKYVLVQLYQSYWPIFCSLGPSCQYEAHDINPWYLGYLHYNRSLKYLHESDP